MHETIECHIFQIKHVNTLSQKGTTPQSQIPTIQFLNQPIIKVTQLEILQPMSTIRGREETKLSRDSRPFELSVCQICDGGDGCQQRYPLSDRPRRNPGLPNIEVRAPRRGDILYFIMTLSQTYRSEESKSLSCAEGGRSIGSNHGREGGQWYRQQV